MSARKSLPWLSVPTSTDQVIAPASSAPVNERRDFLKIAGMGGLLVAASALGVRRLDATTRGGMEHDTNAEPWEPHAYVQLSDDGTVSIYCHRSEMGQGIRTTMPMIIADEMEADWSRCRVEQALGDETRYGSQNTDGSTSIRDFLDKYRQAGATARALLEDAAATCGCRG